MRGTDQEEYQCVRCEGKQQEAVSLRTRITAVHCRGCGAAAYPTRQGVVIARKEKRCDRCNAKLRAVNPGKRCSLCRERGW